MCSDFHISISSKQFSFLRTNGGKIAPDTFKWLKKWWKSYNGTEELYKDFVMKTIQDEVRILKKGDTTPSKIFSKDFIVKNRLTSSEQVESFFVKNFKLTQELLSTMQDSELSKHLKESFFEDLKNFLELTLELILEQVYELHCDENFLHVGCFTDDADKNLRRLSKLRNLYECGRKNLRDVVTGGLLETLKEQKGIWWKKISSNENGFGLGTLTFPIGDAKGKHLRFTGYIKTENITARTRIAATLKMGCFSQTVFVCFDFDEIFAHTSGEGSNSSKASRLFFINSSKRSVCITYCFLFV